MLAEQIEVVQIEANPQMHPGHPLANGVFRPVTPIPPDLSGGLMDIANNLSRLATAVETFPAHVIQEVHAVEIAGGMGAAVGLCLGLLVALLFMGGRRT